MNIKDMYMDGDNRMISLASLANRPIKDVTGYLSSEFDGVTFKLHEIIFEDGTRLGIEGEHDFPYIVEYPKTPLLSEEEWEELYRQGEDEDAS